MRSYDQSLQAMLLVCAIQWVGNIFQLCSKEASRLRFLMLSAMVGSNFKPESIRLLTSLLTPASGAAVLAWCAPNVA